MSRSDRKRSDRKSIEEQDRRVEEFLCDNKDLNFIDKATFDECYYKFKNWLDVQVLVPYLMRYHLLTANDEHYLTNPYTSCVEKSFHLVRVAEKGGRNGFMLLYMCILESIEETRGHADAVTELDIAAKGKKELSGIMLPDEPIGYPNEANPDVQNEVNKLQDLFSSVASSLLQELDDKNFDVKAVRCRIMVLPEHVNKEIFLSLSIEDLSKHCDSIHILFHFLNANVWNFVDYHLLKYMVDIFGTEEIKGHMIAYIQQLEQFQGSTTVHDFVACWAGHCIKPSKNYVEFEVQFKPDHLQEFTLLELNQFRQKIENKFLPPLSEYAMIHYRLRFGSFIVTWILPMKLAMTLKQGVPELESHEMFESYFVEYLSIGNEVIYNAKEYTSITTAMLGRLKQDYYSLQSLDEVFNRQESATSASMMSVFDDYHLSSQTPLPATKGSHSDSSISSTASGDEDEKNEKPVDLGELEDMITLPPSSYSFINVSFNDRQERKKYDSGRFPSIAVNNDGVVVEVCHQMATYWMLYRVGKLQEGGIDWNVSPSLSKPSKTYYGSGTYPQISINDRNVIVEVHGGLFKEKCYYRVGKIIPEEGSITWFSSKSFERIVGHYPNVSINNHNYVVAVYQRDILTKTFCYRVGRISIMEEGEIVWVTKEHTVKWKAENVSVDINSDNMVVLAFQTRMYHIHCLVGRLDFVRGEILWGDPVHLHAGVCLPSISLNDNNHVILVHKNAINFSLFCDVGMVVWEKNVGMISWSQKKNKKTEKYGKGRCPSACINEHGRVVEAHEAALPHSGHLHYYTGQIVL